MSNRTRKFSHCIASGFAWSFICRQIRNFTGLQHTFHHKMISRISGWALWGVYHHIHHVNHRIPFYRLPELYRDIPEFRQAGTTSLHPFEILRCLRLKVWCVETQRMVGVQGL
jgi:fatty acid desaturase